MFIIDIYLLGEVSNQNVFMWTDFTELFKTFRVCNSQRT